jgi:hypothetical protein
MTVPKRIEIRDPKSETREKAEIRDPKQTRTHQVSLRPSGFGLLSDLGLRVSDFSCPFPLIHNACHHPSGRAFVIAHCLAGRKPIGGDDDPLVHAGAVRINGDLRHALGLAELVDRLADD